VQAADDSTTPDAPRLGDERFVALVQREHRGLTAASALIVGDRARAEEIVQDVLERTYRRWSTVDTYDRPGAWVRRAVVNQSISVARRDGSERHALDRLRRRRAPRQEPPESPQEIWAAVRELPAPQATAIVLHYGADLSIATVADEMDLSEAAVKTLLYRARNALRRHDIVEEMTK
jgi:RNA polymerase sigma-70 factor (ECF subfamily)